MLYQVVVNNLNIRDVNEEIVGYLYKGDKIDVDHIESGTNYDRAYLKDSTYVHANFCQIPFIEKIQKKKKKEDKE